MCIIQFKSKSKTFLNAFLVEDNRYNIRIPYSILIINISIYMPHGFINLPKFTKFFFDFIREHNIQIIKFVYLDKIIFVFKISSY